MRWLLLQMPFCHLMWALLESLSSRTCPAQCWAQRQAGLISPHQGVSGDPWLPGGSLITWWQPGLSKSSRVVWCLTNVRATTRVKLCRPASHGTSPNPSSSQQSLLLSIISPHATRTQELSSEVGIFIHLS